MDAEQFWRKVKLRLSEIGKKQAWLSDETGIVLQSIRNKIHLQKFPSLEDTVSILNALGLSWSDFEKYPNLEDIIPEDSEAPAEEIETVAEEETTEPGTKIPVLELAFSAGHGQFQPEFAQVKKYLPVPDHLKYLNESLQAGYVRGISMEPTFYNDDVIIYDRNGYDGQDGVYVIILGGMGYVKRLHKTPEGVEIISDNKEYKPMFEKAESEDFHVIGRVHEVHRQVD